ncbi:MAG: aminoglycoside phosphotransferase family protein [Ilumatobacteraceae bacterium]
MERILAVASQTVGPCVVVADLSWPHGESIVLELVTHDGHRLIGKAHRQPRKYAAELHAYRNWVGALGARGPTLIASDDDARVLIMTRLDAHHLMLDSERRRDRDVSRQAGQLLRRLHGSQPPMPIRNYAARQRERLEEWIARATPGILAADEIAFARDQVALFDQQADPLGVPCHRDWQPRNWLVDDDGRMYVIDFEHSKVGPWHDDLHRLWWDEWRGRPELAAAFFDGYHGELTDDERSALIAASCIGHLCTIVWAAEHTDVPFGAFGRRSLRAAMATDIT